MDVFIKTLTSVFKTINSTLSDYILIILLVGTGIFFTVCTRFVQVRMLWRGNKAGIWRYFFKA